MNKKLPNFVFLCLLMLSLPSCFLNGQIASLVDSSNPIEEIENSLKLESTYDGQGSQLDHVSLQINDTLDIFPIHRDSAGNYLENVEVAWIMNGSIGNLNVLSGGKRAQLTATQAGNAQIIAKFQGLSRTIDVLVNPNVLPTATNDTFYTSKNTGIAILPVLANDLDADADQDSLSIKDFTQGAYGTVADNDDNTLSYTPMNGFSGKDSFSYTVQDGRGGETTATVIVNVMTPYTWTGINGNGLWSTSSNWCGSIQTNNLGCQGANNPPTNLDLVIFDNTCTNCNAVITSAVNIEGILLSSTYTGTITQSISGSQLETIAVASSGWVQRGGIFVGGDADITVNGVFSLEGASHYTATSARTALGLVTLTNTTLMKVESSTTFGHNFGTWRFAGSRPWDCNITVYTLDVPPVLNLYNVELFGKATGCGGGYSQHEVISGSVIRVNGDMVYANGLFTGIWELYGNLTSVGGANGFAGGYGVFKIVGSSDQTITGESGKGFPGIEIASTGGTVHLVGNIGVTGSFKYTSGSVNVGTSTVRMTLASLTIDTGALELNNLVFDNWWGIGVTVLGNVNVNGNFQVSGGHGQINGGHILVKGNVTLDSASMSGNASLSMIGSSPQVLSHLNGIFPSGLFTINNASGVTLGSSVTFSGAGHNMQISNGTLDLSTYIFSGIGQLNISSTAAVNENTGNITYVGCSAVFPATCPAN